LKKNLIACQTTKNYNPNALKCPMVTFKIEKDGDEFHVWCPELPGCHTHGRTHDEAMKNLVEAMTLYLEVLAEEQMTHQRLEIA
jgi:predicted RNase H-like HicB family nuclease